MIILLQYFVFHTAGAKTVTISGLDDFDVKFRVGTKWQGKEVQLSLSVQPCAGDRCLREKSLMRNTRFDPSGRQRKTGRSENLTFTEDLKDLKPDFIPIVCRREMGGGDYVHHHYQSLNREGRWGTTDDFATSFLHFSLFSTAL